MSKHTPGPWAKFSFPGTCGVTGGSGRMSADVAHCSGFNSERTRDEEEANATLIAAAPDLLNAVRFLLSNPANRISDADVAAANAAIDKATR